MAEPFSHSRFEEQILAKEEFHSRRQRSFFPSMIDARFLVEQAQRNIRAWAQRQSPFDLRDDNLVCFSSIHCYHLSFIISFSEQRWAIV